MKHYPAKFKADAVALYRSGPETMIKSVSADTALGTATLYDDPPGGDRRAAREDPPPAR
ncbi:hypothetical protein [Streptomyces sp. NPDC059278]|uniref:hypothetical protein n=1 Tax=Streptomyces sp. NPDC059278 TaxID=3346801 RepID=UPI0036809117